MDREELFEALNWQPTDADNDAQKHLLALVRAGRDALRRDFQVTLKELPEAMDKAVYVLERFPLIVDAAEGQATRFLKYQRGSVLLVSSPQDMAPESLRCHLVGALKHGTLLVLDFDTLHSVELEQFFSPETFPQEVLTRQALFSPSVLGKLLRPHEGDPEPSEFVVNDQFKLVVVCQSASPPPKTALAMCVLHVHLGSEHEAQGDGDPSSSSSTSSETGKLAKLLGVGKEVKRNSVELVEAAFDGDLEAVKRWLDKNYDLDSEDGHAHSALSEAACQGHNGVLCFLLERGADPNKCNDELRSPLYRAAYSGHLETAELLLTSGADPRIRTKHADSAFDVAKTPAVRELLASWAIAETDRLGAVRRKLIEAQWQARIAFHVEREQFALRQTHQELFDLAVRGDAKQVEARLEQLTDDSLATGERPRASANIRNESGSTLLAVAAQHDHHELVSWLLTKWRWYAETAQASSFVTGPQQQLAHKHNLLAKLMKPNVNARDCRGWTPVAIAVFHEAKRSLRLLLSHGADPKLKNQYNKNAFDFAKDELDAATNIIKSRAEIRQVLVDWENERRVGTGAGESGGEAVEAVAAQVPVAPGVSTKKRGKKLTAKAAAPAGSRAPKPVKKTASETKASVAGTKK